MICDVNKIDVLAERNDGKIELIIISTGDLDDSKETQTRLLDKIEKYLEYINSDEFKTEFGQHTPEEILIILKLDKIPNNTIEGLFKNIVHWVNENGASIEMIVELK